MDGATAWQRFTKITLPLMKPAILVALLFRTLDAFRIFDNIFILTGGANNTGSVSILGYDNLFNALNLGIGSAHLGADLHLRRDHRLHLHQGLRHRGPGHGPEAGDRHGCRNHHAPAEGRLGRRRTSSSSRWR